MPTHAATLAIAMLTWSTLSAQNQPAAPRCDTPEFRQFDFWVGDWDVTAGGKPAGTNRVTLEESGCVVHEHWTGTGGSTGQSLNFYTRAAKQWRQVWIDNSGNPLDLWGTYHDGKLTLAGKTETQNGTVLQRIIFFNNPDGTVRQLWESSADGGKTWSVSFDGLYRKRKAG
jgi:hypothetical protein